MKENIKNRKFYQEVSVENEEEEESGVDKYTTWLIIFFIAAMAVGSVIAVIGLVV